MAFENRGGNRPPLERSWCASDLAFRRPRGRTAPTDGITCGTGNYRRRTSDRSSIKDPERHLVAQQHHSVQRRPGKNADGRPRRARRAGADRALDATAARCRATLADAATRLKGAGFDAAQLKSAGFGLTMLKRAGFDAAQLKSAGFDAAAGDPLGGMRLTPAGYSHLTRELLTLADGRLVVALEGGYNTGVRTRCVRRRSAFGPSWRRTPSASTARETRNCPT